MLSTNTGIHKGEPMQAVDGKPKRQIDSMKAGDICVVQWPGKLTIGIIKEIHQRVDAPCELVSLVGDKDKELWFDDGFWGYQDHLVYDYEKVKQHLPPLPKGMDLRQALSTEPLILEEGW